jgi:HemY protein
MRTLFKALVFLLVLIAIVVAGTWIANNGGQVSMDWGPYQMRTTVARLALLAALAFLVLLIVVGLVNLVLRGPARLKHHMREKRQEKGYEQLTRGLVAVAAGDAHEARRKARKADIRR